MGQTQIQFAVLDTYLDIPRAKKICLISHQSATSAQFSLAAYFAHCLVRIATTSNTRAAATIVSVGRMQLKFSKKLC